MPIDAGMLQQRPDQGIADHVVEGDIGQTALFGQGFYFLSQGQQLPCIGTDVVGELGRLVQGAVHAVGDELAQTRQRHLRETIRSAGHGRGLHQIGRGHAGMRPCFLRRDGQIFLLHFLTRQRRDMRLLLHYLQDIPLDDPAAGTRSFYFHIIHTLLFGQLFGTGGDGGLEV